MTTSTPEGRPGGPATLSVTTGTAAGDAGTPLAPALTLSPPLTVRVGYRAVTVAVTVTADDLIGLAVQYPDGRFLRIAFLPATLPRREPSEPE